MPTYTQTERPLVVTTPLGKDAVLGTGLRFEEHISRLFQATVDVLAEVGTDIPFEGLLGQGITVAVQQSGQKYRYFHGICQHVAQGESNYDFTSYTLTLVPQVWMLTKTIRTRIFQQISVPDILKKVLTGFDVKYHLASYEKRDYCVQYRESDWDFASRLMEEEGIFYYFHFEDGKHTLVIADKPSEYEEAAPATYKHLNQAAAQDDEFIFQLAKHQQLTSNKSTLWDHCFEMPGKNLEASVSIMEQVSVGEVTHKLNQSTGMLEVYDCPGAYAGRFDGIDPGGSDRAADLQKIFADSKRTVGIRMQAEAATAVYLKGRSQCRQFSAGHWFQLSVVENAVTANLKVTGDYVVRSIVHTVIMDGIYQPGGNDHIQYDNSFTIFPKDLPYRPERITHKPTVAGSQTATVVGPAGSEIFCDKYGRVKVQFHWDREGKKDGGSSCWIRVGTPMAGQNWGMIHIPRIGQEVIVDFLEGDPDQPLIVGMVYNAGQMPPFELPEHKTQSGMKSRSSLGGNAETFNEICFEDKKGEELLYIRAEKDQTIAVENDESHWVGHDRLSTIDHDETTLVHHDRTETVDNNETIMVHGNRTETVDKDETITVHQNRTETVDKNEQITIGINRTENVGAAENITVGAARTTTIGAADSLTIGAGQSIAVGGAQSTSVAKDQSLSVEGAQSTTVGKDRNEKISGASKTEIAKDGAIVVGKNFSIKAKDTISLVCGDAKIIMKNDGSILISGKDILVKGSGKIVAKASSDMVLKGSKIAQN